MSTLIFLASIGKSAEIAEDEELARAIEQVLYLMCERRYGVEFWEEHSTECLKFHADDVECWENLIQKLSPVEDAYAEGQLRGEPARTYKGKTEK